MRKRIYLVVALLGLLLVGCTNNNDDNKYLEFKTKELNLYTCEVCELPINTNCEMDEIKISSSNESVLVIEGTNIKTIGNGQAEVTISYNNKKDTLKVNVTDDGNTLYLDCGVEEISLFKGSSYNITSSVRLRGHQVDAQIKYKSSDEQIATIDENGKIDAKKAGECNILVTASYQGYDSDDYTSLARTIKIKVNPVVILEISADNLVLNPRHEVIGDATYTNETVINYNLAVESGGEVTYPTDVEIKWIIENKDVIDITCNKVTSKQLGKTFVHAEYKLNGITYSSNYLEIKVEKPLIKVNNEAFDIDLYVNNINLSKDYMMANDQNILNVYDSNDLSTNILEQNKLVNYDEVGLRKWIVESTNYNYEINVCCVSKIINTKEELSNLHIYGKDVSKGISGISSFDGYFILGNDIDMSGVRIKTTCGITTGATSINYNGFKGTFDGRGYTVKNASVSSSNGGLFGTMNKSAVVKNVAFVGVTISGDSGLISSNFGGEISNVYVEGKLTCTRATSQNPSSLLASKIYDGAKISNCIIRLTNPNVNNSYSSAVGSLVTAKEDCMNNVYVLGTDYKVLSTTDANSYNKLVNPNNGQFVDYSDLLKVDLTSFNNYWFFGESAIQFAPLH